MLIKIIKILTIHLLLFLLPFPSDLNAQKFAVIGDYGYDGGPELLVSNLVKSWNPDFIVTVGDNNYDDGLASTIDENIGKYYQEFIKPYNGVYGPGSPDVNRFFPVPGNHDWDSPDGNLQPYLDYFQLYHNERYYDFIWGDLHFFMIDSDPREPDGNTESSTQAIWFQNKMLNSTEKWNIVILHHAPYSSAGSTTELRWPFKNWGADAVIAGHKHNYERLIVDGLVYIVDGLGGKSRQGFGTPLQESIVRYWNDYGAMLVDANSTDITFSFYNKAGTLIDSYNITDPLPVELAYFSGNLNGNTVQLNWKTETEVNNYGFEIQRSINSDNWITIAFIEGNGNSNSPKYYSYVDYKISSSGKYFYRLKQVDNDGTFEYSNIVTVNVGSPEKFYLSQNYPNPFNPVTIIKYSIPEDEPVAIRVYNMLGEVVAELVNQPQAAGEYRIEFDGSNLPAGSYFYSIITEKYRDVKKMTLLK